MTASATLQARLIGGFRLTTPEGKDVTPRSRKAAAIVGYLLLSGGPVARRERLASLLWSEKPENQARDSLRQCLADLRRAGLTGDRVVVNAREVAVRTALIRTDIGELQGGLERGELEPALRHLAATELDLLSGLDDLDTAFADWLVIERERWSQSVVADLLRLIGKGTATRRQLLALTDAVLRLDPYQEEAIRTAMEGMAAESGGARTAVALFDRYRRSLEREYDVEPSPELAAFADRLRRAEPAPPVAGSADRPATLAPAVRRAPPRVAVAVGTGGPDDPDLTYVADAFRHDLISTLSRFKEWTVVTPPSEREEGRAFLAQNGVDYALEGALARVGARNGGEGTRVEVALTDCNSDDRLIEEQFAVRADRWIAVLNDICRKVGARLQVAVSAARLRNVAGRTAEQRSAYDLWLWGHHLASFWRKEDDDGAEALFEQAIALDPSLACAYSSLAGILQTRHIVFPGWARTAEDRERALVLARRAVELDRMDCRNHVILGWAHALAQRFDSADFHFQLAVELNPSNPDVVIAAGTAAVLGGAHVEGAALVARAFDLNPLPPDFYFGYRATASFLCGDLHGCVEDVARAPDVFPDIRAWSAAAFAHLGEPDLARAELQACYTELRRRWVGRVPEDEAELLKHLSGIVRIRREEDRRSFLDGLRIAAGA